MTTYVYMFSGKTPQAANNLLYAFDECMLPLGTLHVNFARHLHVLRIACMRDEDVGASSSQPATSVCAALVMMDGV
jgi:hypothetical protein